MIILQKKPTIEMVGGIAPFPFLLIIDYFSKLPNIYI